MSTHLVGGVHDGHVISSRYSDQPTIAMCADKRIGPMAPGYDYTELGIDVLYYVRQNYTDRLGDQVYALAGSMADYTSLEMAAATRRLAGMMDSFRTAMETVRQSMHRMAQALGPPDHPEAGRR